MEAPVAERSQLHAVHAEEHVAFIEELCARGGGMIDLDDINSGNNAGNTIDMYDAATYRYLRTVTLDGDMTTQFYVVPRAATAR